MIHAGIANAPCSWGVLEFDLKGDVPGWEQVLDEISGTGYTGTELGDWGFLPNQPERLKSVLEARGLSLVAAFVPVMLKDPDAVIQAKKTAVRIAQLLRDVGGETPLIVLADDNGTDPIRTDHAGRISPQQGLSEADWEVAAHTANQIALAVQEETGLRTAFHPHCAGYVETSDEVAMMMSATHPRLVGLCLDTAHCAYGGGNPLELTRRYGDRITHVHFKGYHELVAAEARNREMTYFEAVERGVFCELGESSLDFQEIAGALAEAEYEGWIVVEQDVLPGMGDPEESSRKNREYLASIGL